MHLGHRRLSHVSKSAVFPPQRRRSEGPLLGCESHTYHQLIFKNLKILSPKLALTTCLFAPPPQYPQPKFYLWALQHYRAVTRKTVRACSGPRNMKVKVWTNTISAKPDSFTRKSVIFKQWNCFVDLTKARKMKNWGHSFPIKAKK